MRRRPAVNARIAAALAGLVVVLAAGCASSVAGTGSIAADASRLPAATGSASPSGSPTPGTGGTTPGTDGTTPGSGGRTTLKCSGRTISPAGAPYCFSIPAGFTDVSSSVTVDATVGNEKFRSAVALADRDLIIVTVYSLTANTDSIASDTLEGELKTVLAQLATQGFTFESTQAERGTVDGARSFSYRAAQPKNKLQSDVYFVFRGKNEVEVNCQWQTKQAEIQKGCTAVLHSLQFKTVR
jgi:hypothetical protein